MHKFLFAFFKNYGKILYMETKENLHQGHRARMMDKFIKHSNSLLDHELLEVLLFGLIPRVDTNKIAHRLIQTFGSLEVLFNASGQDIMSVEGVGKTTASHIKAIGEIYNRIKEREANVIKTKMRTIEQAREKVLASFKINCEEVLKVFLLDKKHSIITSLAFEKEKVDMVSMAIPEIAKAIAINKPAYVILAHNHPSGIAKPSASDDAATKKVHFLCQVHGVALLDHFIVGTNEIYSYHENNRFENILENSKVDRILNLEEIR